MMQLIKKFAKEIYAISGDSKLMISLYQKDDNPVVFVNTVVNNYYAGMETQFYLAFYILGSDAPVRLHKTPRDLVQMDAHEREQGKRLALRVEARKIGKIWTFAKIPVSLPF